MDERGISRGGNGPGNHAVIVNDVVFDSLTATSCKFNMQNSHGDTYADRGFIYVTWDRHFRETVRNHAFYAIGSTNDGEDTI
jgi:hypothetical protein